MIKSLVDCYRKRDTLEICMEEGAGLIKALSHKIRDSGDGYATDRTPQQIRRELVEALAKTRNAMNSVMYQLEIRESELQEKIKASDETASVKLLVNAGALKPTGKARDWRKYGMTDYGDINAYCKARNKAIRTHDVFKVKEFVKKWKKAFEPPVYRMVMEDMSDRAIIASTHKLVLGLRDFSEQEKTDSRRWLLENGFKVG